MIFIQPPGIENKEGGERLYWKKVKSPSQAAVRFAKAIAETRGKVSDEELADVRTAGFTDADIVAIAGLTAQFLFTNFMSNISEPELDFPAIESSEDETVLAFDPQ